MRDFKEIDACKIIKLGGEKKEKDYKHETKLKNKCKCKNKNPKKEPKSLLTRKCWKACILYGSSRILVQSGCSGSGGTGDSVSI